MRLIALSGGDTAGVGPWLIARAWQALRTRKNLAFFLALDPKHPAFAHIPTRTITHPHEAIALFPHALPLLPPPVSHPHPPAGKPTQASAHAAHASLSLALTCVHEGNAHALVTAPVDKHLMHQHFPPFYGHTEWLGNACSPPATPLMLLHSPLLAAASLTTHIPLKEVAGALARMGSTGIAQAGATLANGLRRLFRIPSPRLAVAGLNPHAGDGGLLGTEDAGLIAPAITKMRKQGIDANGPFAADSLFHPDARAAFDAALCAYHDQALIPIKTLDFHRSVNITLGLPFLRTSPDHGPAFALAGSPKANPTSLIRAITLAARLRSP